MTIARNFFSNLLPSLSPEKAFVLLSSFFGLIFLVLTPPFQVPDEFNHFYRSFQVSEFTFVSLKQNGKVGGIVPASFKTTVDEVIGDVRWHANVKLNSEAVFSNLFRPLDPDKRIFVEFPNTALSSPAPYIPQAFGMMVGKILKLSPLVIMYLSRLINLTLHIVLVYFAIKIIPFYKWVFFLLSLTPMTVFLRSSVSADAVLIGLSFLLIAVFFRYIYDPEKEIKKSGLFILFFLCLLLSLSKQVYLFIIFLFLLIPINKFGSKKRYWCIFALTGFICVASVGFWTSQILSKDLVVINEDARLENVSYKEQKKYVFANPWEFVKIMSYTFKVNYKNYTEEFIGKLGWLDTKLPKIIINSFLIVLLAAGLLDTERKICITLRDKFLFAIIAVLIAVIISLAEYLHFTPVRHHLVLGTQGRHFIPLAPLIFSLFYINFKENRLNGKYIKIVLISYPAIILTFTSVIVFNRYY